jgi:hypothetical protein
MGWSFTGAGLNADRTPALELSRARIFTQQKVHPKFTNLFLQIYNSLLKYRITYFNLN